MNVQKAGWEGRSRLAFPEERVWSPQPPPMAPHAQMCPLQYTSHRMVSTSVSCPRFPEMRCPPPRSL